MAISPGATLSGGLGTSLLGTSDPVRFTDPFRADAGQPLFERNPHGAVIGDPRRTIRYTLFIIIVSALLFVTIVATFDVMRNFINFYYSENIIQDGTLTSQLSNLLITSGFFALFCWIIMLIFVPLFFYLIRQQHRDRDKNT